MKKILIVEDQHDFRETLKTALLQEYVVSEAANGKIAKELIAIENFDLVLTDIQMPHFTGIDLLEWIQLHKPTPVILMTGFSQILETHSAFELGAKEFLAKPFSLAELQQKIKHIIGTGEQNPETPPLRIETDRDFCHVPIQDFISAKATEFNLYIRLAQDKFVKVAHQGGKIDGTRVAAYMEKQIRFLYVKQQDFRKLVGFTMQVAKAVGESAQIDHEKKMRFMSYTAEMITQNAFVSGVDLEAFNSAKGFLETSVDVLTENTQVFELLTMLKNQNNFLYAHSLGVSLFSVMIGKQLGWQSSQTLFKLAMGGLLHDIGKKEIPQVILEKPRALLTQEERRILETHTTRGKEILESLKNIPSEVVHIAAQHHEDTLGQGFPRQMTKLQIHPLTLVVSVANTFCQYTIKNHSDDEPEDAAAAILHMKTFKLDGLDPAAFKALELVIKTPPAK